MSVAWSVARFYIGGARCCVRLCMYEYVCACLTLSAFASFTCMRALALTLAPCCLWDWFNVCAATQFYVLICMCMCAPVRVRVSVCACSSKTLLCTFLCQMSVAACSYLYVWVCVCVCLCLKLWRVFGISDSHVSKSLRHIQTFQVYVVVVAAVAVVFGRGAVGVGRHALRSKSSSCLSPSHSFALFLGRSSSFISYTH